MTALDSTTAADPRQPTSTAQGTSRDDTRDVPALVAGTELFGVQRGSGYCVAPHLARRADGQVLQLTPLIYAVLDAVDGHRDIDEVARAAGSTLGRELHPEDVRQLIDDKLRPLGLVLGRDGTHPPMRRSNPLLALRARFVVAKPEVTRRITAPFAMLFNPAVVVVATLAFAVICYWVLFRKGLASAAYEAFNRPGLLLAVFAITVVSAGFHEFGHAAGLRRGGGTPGAIGAGLYLIYPAFYTDVTDSYRLSRAARIRTDLGGLYFNALAAVAMFALWSATRWDALLLVVAAQVLQMVRQLPPLIRCDGYHLLADVIGVPDLYQHIGPTLRSFVPGRRRRDRAVALRLWARLVVTGWTLFVVPILVLTVLLSVIALPRILGTTAHSLAAQWHQLAGRAHDGNVAGVGANVLAIAALVIPVGGIFYLLARMVRRHVTTTWRRTRGQPRKRAVACLALVAILCGLGYEWWPRSGAYAPIGPGERGTVQDALPVAAHAPLTAATVDRASLRTGDQGSTVMAWQGGAQLPTRAHPALALVFVPRTGSGTTWVFPFARPLPPGVGDNQALAVATKDGGAAYDVAFALVWADGDEAVNTNSAYAFASCTGCVAVAVSFQVVLVASDANVVAPVNVAVAVNYQCDKCLTLAVAVQLVAQLSDALSPDAMAALTNLWATITAWSQNLQGLTLAQIQAQLEQFEQQILAIVTPSVVAAAVSSTTASASASPSASASSSPTDSPSATASPSASPSDSPTASPSDSASPSPSSDSPDPTPTPSSSP